MRLLASLVLAAGFLGCATGSELDTETDQFGDYGGAAGLGGAGGSTGQGNSNYGGFGAHGGMGGDGFGGGTAASGPGGFGGQGTAGGGTCDFTSPNDCAGAVVLPEVAGDKNQPPAVVTGSTSEWFRILIGEQDGNISEEDLSYTVTLTSPAGMDYDLIVHPGSQDGPPNCNATAILGQGQPETVSQSWDDDQGIGGEDDDVWLSIQVVYVSGMVCGPSAEWTLTIQGHT
jgi:hypothetical protein